MSVGVSVFDVNGVCQCPCPCTVSTGPCQLSVSTFGVGYWCPSLVSLLVSIGVVDSGVGDGVSVSVIYQCLLSVSGLVSALPSVLGVSCRCRVVCHRSLSGIIVGSRCWLPCRRQCPPPVSVLVSVLMSVLVSTMMLVIGVRVDVCTGVSTRCQLSISVSESVLMPVLVSILVSVIDVRVDVCTHVGIVVTSRCRCCCQCSVSIPVLVLLSLLGVRIGVGVSVRFRCQCWYQS